MAEKLYLDVIPRIRVYEKKLMNDSQYNRLLDLENINDVFKTLVESTSDISADDIDVMNYEEFVKMESEKLFKSLNEFKVDNKFKNIFLKKYKFNNLKMMIKSKYSNIDLDNSFFNIENFDNELIFMNIKEDRYLNLPKDISEVVKKACNDFEENRNPQNIDILFDKVMFKELLEEAQIIKNKFLIDYVKNLIDVYNVRTLFRAKKLELNKMLFDSALVTGGNIGLNNLNSMFLDPKENILNKFQVISMYKHIKEGLESYINEDDLSILDRQLDDYIIEYLRSARIIPTGLAPIVGYINAKENELKNIRIILISKMNNIDSDSIKRRLRKNYV